MKEAENSTRHRLSLLAIVALTLVTRALNAAERAPEELELSAECTVCHGTDGLGNAAIGAPNIAVLEPWYIKRQLEAYRAGRRGVHPDDSLGAEMQPIAAAIPAAVIDAVVSAVDRFEPRPSVATMDGDAERGRELYTACASCHGASGEGSRELGGPPLAGQSDWYLVRQLGAYRDGWRGTSGDDERGQQMSAAAALLPDARAIDDVVSYIATLPIVVAPAENTSATLAGSIERVPLPGNSTFPILSMVRLGPGTTVIHHSGLTPRPADTDADPTSRAYYGDTKTQAVSVFERMKASLESVGLGMGDVVKMTAFLVGDPEMGGRMDFAGFMDAYIQYFGTAEQPNLPARSAVQVAGLVNPRMLVEIEVIVAISDDAPR